MQHDNGLDATGSQRDALEPAAEGRGEGGEFKVFDRRFWAQEQAAEAAPADERARFPTYVEQLRQQLEQKDQQLREYIAAYKKEVVENLEQTKQRLARDAEQQLKALRARLAEPMIEVLDALERSLQASAVHADVTTLRDGLSLVQGMLVQRLGQLGLERIPSVGAPFDPRVHEAVAAAAVSDPAQDNSVLSELSAGFMLEGRVVRAAKVQVGKCAG